MKTPLEIVMEKFGGGPAVGKIVGCHHTAVYRRAKKSVRDGVAGSVPQWWMPKLLAAAQERGVELTERELIYGEEA